MVEVCHMVVRCCMIVEVSVSDGCEMVYEGV